MKWRVAAVAAVVFATPLAAAGCTDTVGGSAQRATGTEESQGRSYGFAENRCGLLLDTTVAETIGADKTVRPYSGAVCQYVVSRQGTVVDLTFSWFETGNLQRERSLATANHAQVNDVVVQRHPAFLARRAVSGNACSATAATSPGVVSWWVQVRGDMPADPCGDAEKLLAKTLSSDM